MSYTFIDGEQLTAAKVNEHLNHGLIDWQPYGPTWTASTTAPVLGNGTLNGSYTKIGKTIHFRIALAFGSTTTRGAGYYTFTFPENAAGETLTPLGSGHARDNSTAARAMRTAYRLTATTLALTSEAGVLLGHDNPWLWAVDDTLRIAGTYEAA